MPFTKEETEALTRLQDDEEGLDIGAILALVDSIVSEGVASGRFASKAAAAADLDVALWRANAYLNQETYAAALETLRILEPAREAGAHSGVWHYRYATALLCTGRLVEAFDAAQAGIATQPDYPWCRLPAAKLAAHFGDKTLALRYVDEGEALVPGHHQFQVLREEIEAGKSLEVMEYHTIDADADALLLKGLLPVDEMLVKCRAVNCMVVLEDGLRENQRLMKAENFREDSPDGHFVVFDAALEPGLVVPMGFRMNAAGFSHMNPSWLARLAAAIPHMIRRDVTDPANLERIWVRQDRSIFCVLSDPDAPDRVRAVKYKDIPVEFIDLERVSVDEAQAPDVDLSPADQAAWWRSKGEPERAIAVIEAVPEGERNPRQMLELACAKLLKAAGGPRVDERGVWEAIELLSEFAADGRGNPEWWRQYAAAFMLVDMQPQAAAMCRELLSRKPGDEEALLTLRNCEDMLTAPVFRLPFRRRVETAWNAFAAREAELWEKLKRAGRLAFSPQQLFGRPFLWDSDVRFETTPEGVERGVITLSTMGEIVEILPILEFTRRMPESLKSRWRVAAGREPLGGALKLVTNERTLDAANIFFTPERSALALKITLWSREFAGMTEAEAVGEGRGSVMLMLAALIGEAAALRWISVVTLSVKKPEGVLMPLTELPDYLHETNPESADETFETLSRRRLEYWLKPEDVDVPGLDVVHGETAAVVLVNEFRANAPDAVDRLHAEGIAAGFLFFSLKGFENPESRAARMDAVTAALQARLSEVCPPEVCFLCGTASGTRWSYVELYAWDLPPVLDAARAFFMEEPDVLRAGFHSFRRTAGILALKDGEEEPAAVEQPEGETVVPDVPVMSALA